LYSPPAAASPSSPRRFAFPWSATGRIEFTFRSRVATCDFYGRGHFSVAVASGDEAVDGLDACEHPAADPDAFETI
jgi:hypothetical protein